MKLFSWENTMNYKLRILTCRGEQHWDCRPEPAPIAGGGLQAAACIPRVALLSRLPTGKRERQTAVLLPLPPDTRGQGSWKARAGVHPAGDGTCTVLSLQNELRCY